MLFIFDALKLLSSLLILFSFQAKFISFVSAIYMLQYKCNQGFHVIPETYMRHIYENKKKMSMENSQ